MQKLRFCCSGNSVSLNIENHDFRMLSNLRFDTTNKEYLYVSCSKVHRKILEVIYKQERRCSAGVKEEFLMEKLEAKIDENELKIHVDYLDEKGYVLIKPVYDGFVTIRKIIITAKGVNLVGDPRL